MRIKNKNRFLLLVFSLFLLFFILIPTNVIQVENAVVNEKNGDIAFCYFDPTMNNAVKVCVYSQSGEELFTKTFDVSYVPDMLYDDLDLYLLIGKDNIKYSFDRSGNHGGNNVLLETIQEKMFFDSWDYSFIKNMRTKTIGEYVYCYEGPTSFNREARLTIRHGDTEIELYKDGKAASQTLQYLGGFVLFFVLVAGIILLVAKTKNKNKPNGTAD